MKKELAEEVLNNVIQSVTDKEMIRNPLLVLEMEKTRNLLHSEIYSSAAAKAQIDRLISQCPKFLRRDLYSCFVPKTEQDAAISKRKKSVSSPTYKVTNIANPWHGGAPGLGKNN